MFCCIAALSFLLVGTFHTLTLLRLASFAFFRFRIYLAPEMTELESLQLKKGRITNFEVDLKLVMTLHPTIYSMTRL